MSKARRHLSLDGAPQGLHRIQIRSPAHGRHAATNGSVSHGKRSQNISIRNHARSDGGERERPRWRWDHTEITSASLHWVRVVGSQESSQKQQNQLISAGYKAERGS